MLWLTTAGLVPFRTNVNVHSSLYALLANIPVYLRLIPKLEQIDG